MRIMFLNQAPKDPATSRADIEEIEQLLHSYASPGTEIAYHFVDDFPGAMVHEVQGRQQALNGLHHVLEAPAVIEKVTWAAEHGFDAVIQSNTFDPGVEGGRLAVRIPVIGLLRTTLAVAGTLCDRIGMIAPLDGDLPGAWRSICAYHMDHVVVGMRALGIYGADLKQRKTEILERTIDLVRELIRQTGAECIVPLGGKLIPYVVDPKDLESATGAPVLNTKAIGIQYAEMCVRLGLVHSPLSYPPCVARHEHFLQKAYG
jgi:Asp/Glu/hydantoin racemase